VANSKSITGVGKNKDKWTRRACPVTLKFATATKRHDINLLLEAYRGCVNRFIKVLWTMPTEEFGLNGDTLALIPAGRLSERYKSNALKQAIEIVVSTKRAAEATGNKITCPKFTGSAILDAKFVKVQDKEICPGDPFDLVVTLSTLEKRQQIAIPTCRTKPMNKWLLRPGARLIQGCELSEDRLILWVEEPAPIIAFAPKEDAVVYGVDKGMKKLLTVKNDKNQTAFLGREYWELQGDIRRAKPDSHARDRLLRERDHVIGRALNALPWGHFDVIGVEDLTGITHGKGDTTKEFRKQRSPWAHRKMFERLAAKAQENRVLLVTGHPFQTSRECPACRCASELNRRGEQFRCVACGHTEDADGVGAGNVRSRALKNLEGRQKWLANHPNSSNRAHSVHRRSVASRRPKR